MNVERVRTILTFLLISTCAIAQEIGNRDAVRRTIADLNHRLADPDAGPVADLFSKDASPADREGLTMLDRQLREPAGRPWSEMSPPAIVVESIWFPAADVALADGAEWQVTRGSAGIPLLFVMKRESGRWLIAAVRVLMGWNRASARNIERIDRR